MEEKISFAEPSLLTEERGLELEAVGAVVMLAGDRIAWANCATGFLWRTWLLLYILPWWLAAARRPEIRPSS